MNNKSHYLTNDLLEIEIANVGAYSGSRFDWTGFITQVTLKQQGHTFCVLEKPLPRSSIEGAGICNEFGLFAGIGYADAKVGDAFPKLGVGLLTKLAEAPYAHDIAYPITSYSIETNYSQSDSIEFIVQPEDCRGYAAKLIKKISLHESSLFIDYTLENVGSLEIRTNEYTHNFIGINQHNLGPDYSLRFSFPIEIENIESIPNILQFIGNEITWNGTPQEPFYCRLKEFGQNEAVYWELTHQKSGVGIREVSDFPVSMIALWGTTHVVSPEVFIDIYLKPGEVQSWRRRYDFFETKFI